MYWLLLLGWSAVALAPIAFVLGVRVAWLIESDELLEHSPQLFYLQVIGRLRFTVVLVPVIFLALHVAVASAAGSSSRLALPILQAAATSTPVRALVRVALVAMGLVWCAGFLVLVARALRALISVQRLRHESAAVSEALSVRMAIATVRLGLSHTVTLREACVDSPMVVGRRAPVVLVPRGMWCTSDEDADALLLHELAHVRRDDAHTNRWIVLASVVLWWHPVIRRLIGAARAAREFACDDMAAAALGSPASLAHALVALAEARDGRRHVVEPALLSFAANSHPLVGRVRRLVRGRAESSVAGGTLRKSRTRQWLEHAAALAIVMGVAASSRQHNDTQRAFAKSIVAPSATVTIEAHDDAGAFRVIMRRGRVEGVVIDRDTVTSRRLVAHGDSLRVEDKAGRRLLTLAVDPRGAIAWDSRRGQGDHAMQ